MVVYNLFTQIIGTLLIVVLIIFLAPMLMSAYGKSFSAGKSVLVLMAISWVFMSISSVLWDVMVSNAVIWKGFIFNLISAMVLVYSAWRMAGYGAKGIAMSYILYYLAAAVMQISYFLYKHKPAKDMA